MAQQKSLKRLSKLISYVLGHNPAEFGLVPNPDGFVKLKEFLKAVSEEGGLRYVRRSDINEILTTLPDPPIEIKDNYIRAKHRDKLSGLRPAQSLPKLLFTCVRRKAYPTVVEKGIFPMGFSHVILSSKPEMAERMGKRKDPEPVLLSVQTRISMDRGIVFYKAGDPLFLTESISPGCFTGPAPPKPKEAPEKQKTPEKEILIKMPGSFLMEFKDKKTVHKPSKHSAKSSQTTVDKDHKKVEQRKRKRERDRPPWRR
ncbi:MAG: RNA 2'-phosphotransferase [Deltaproteobacteria bacterium]|nr:RNA 2'-phosphotransferase [Deltaproteobacteria bacterium]